MQDRVPEKFENEVVKLLEKSESSSEGLPQETLNEFTSNIKEILKEDKSDLSDEDAARGAELIGNAMAFMLGGQVKQETLPKFTNEEIATLSAQIKTILTEEKIPQEKHDAFVNFFIDKSQEDIENINNLTIEKLESDDLKNLNWTDKLIELIDCKNLAISSLISKIQHLELNKRNLDFALNKTIMLALQKQMMQEKEIIERQREQEKMQQEIFKSFFEMIEQSMEAANEENQNEEEQDSQLSKKFGS